MSKIGKLFINENIKTWKRFSTKLLIIVVLLALIGTLGIAKLLQFINKNEIITNTAYGSTLQIEIDNLKEMLKNEYLDEETREHMQNELKTYELALEYGIEPYGYYWKSEVLRLISSTEDEKLDASQIAKLNEILKNDDYNGYIEFQKTLEKQKLDKKKITQEEYEDSIYIIELKAKAGIGKNENEPYWKQTLISSIQSARKSIRTDIDAQTSKILTVEEKQKYEESILINEYRLENNMPPIDYVEDNYRMVFETLAPMFVVAVIAILIMIIAGGMISNEVSTGTIKFWALTPNKRWKILTAKILSILFYLVVITLIMAILTIIFANIFFTDEGLEYLYVKNGNVKVIGNVLYTIEMYFAKIIPVAVFAIFALMLSTVTRNTAVAVSFSIATYMGNGIVMAILNQYITKDWIKFVPFNNLNIADKIFVNTENIMGMFAESFATSTSLGFSLAVLGVCTILMLVTMYDSFNNKDII